MSLPLGPTPPPDPTTGLPRHRTFGPLPQHTDACIRDAAQYGFCDHTRLTVSPSLVYRRARILRATRRAHILRTILSYVGPTLIVLVTIYLSHQIGLAVLWVLPVFSLGWLLVFTCGLPRFLTEDIRDAISPEQAAALHDQIAARSRTPRKPKGPSGR